MIISRIYTGADGRSHFEDLDIPVEGEAAAARSQQVPARSVAVWQTDSDWGLGPHPAPERQLVVTLAGRSEVRCGDGTSRVFGPGDIMLADDLTGEGHTSHVLEGPRTVLFIPLLDSGALPSWLPSAGAAGADRQRGDRS
jgi:hypothetical protein